MIPWEREIYVSLLVETLEKEANRLRNQNG